MKRIFVFLCVLFSLNISAQTYIVSGAGSANANGTYLQNGTFNSYPAYDKIGDPNIRILFDGYGWQIVEGGPFAMYKNSTMSATPPLTGWTIDMMGSAPAPTLTMGGPYIYMSTTAFSESLNNDGSLLNSTSIPINLGLETFTGANSDDFITAGKVLVGNLPAGLTMQLIRTNDNVLTMNITGSATANNNSNDVNTITLEFLNQAFTGNDSSLIDGNKKLLSINFIQEYYVGSTGDFTTISSAIAGCGWGDILILAAETFTESGLTASKDISFIGQGATQTIIQASATVGTATDRVFNFPYGGSFNVRIEKLTVRNGRVYGAAGGGIKIEGPINTIIRDCEIRDNFSEWGGGGIWTNINNGSISIYNTTIAGNSVNYTNSSGGGLSLGSGTSFISNCTITGNSANVAGGIGTNNSFTIENSTVTGNNAFQTDPGFQGGGGILCANGGSVCNIKNCIVAGNTQVNNVDNDLMTWYGSYYASGGNNIFGNLGSVVFSGNTTGDLYYDPNGTTTPNIGATESSSAIDLHMSALALNGGETRTCALLTGSPAIDPALSNGAPLKDQRNYFRSGTSDIGSYEFNGYLCATIDVSATATSNTCHNSCDGSITILASNGSAPYTYTLNGGAPYSSNTIVNLCPGMYNILVTDNNGCTGTYPTPVEVINNDTITFSAGITSPSCNGMNNGSIGLTINGGVAPYDFNWSNGYSLQNLGNLHAGTYVLTLTDNAGCSTIQTFDIEQPDPLQISFATTSATCGNSNGMVTATISGGTPLYTCLWSTGSDSIAIIDLSSGIYMLQVTDLNNCQAFSVANVSNTNGPTVTVDLVTNVSCFGGSNGSINISVTGGNTPYTYLWSNGITSQDISNLQPGPYEVQVRDNLGCVSIVSQNVEQPQQIVLNYSASPASCGLSDGSASVNVIGGTAPYNYIWSIGQTTATISNIPAGVYFCSVLDLNNCVGSPGSGIAVSNSGAPVIVIDSIVRPSCSTTNGGVYISVSAGTPPYTFIWSNDSTTEDISTLTTGTYSVSVVDDGGCIGMNSALVEATLPLTQPICVVTVDSIVCRNLIVWEKVQTHGISHYKIFRETSTPGVFQNIATVPYDSMSIYLDSVANPLIHAWRYKLASVDSCGNESPLSELHKTIHLTINQGIGTAYNLIWDNYEGFSYNSFIIERYLPTTGWVILDTLPNTLHSYTDVAPSTAGIKYIVRIDAPSACYPSSTMAKEVGGPYGSSFSNMEDEGILVSNSTSDIDNLNFVLYPNPAKEIITLKSFSEIKENMTIEIFDYTGKAVYSQNRNIENEIKIDISGLSKGLYLMQIRGEQTYRIRFVVE